MSKKTTIRKIEGQPERLILLGAIVSTEFLKGTARQFSQDYIRSRPARELLKWCYEYFEKYEKAPAKDIQNMFDANKSKKRISDISEEIEDILSDLSMEFESEGSFNHTYAEESAIKYFKKREIEIRCNLVQKLLDAEDILEAEEAMASFKRVSDPINAGIDVLSDKASILEAFFSNEDTLFEFPGALGRVIGPLSRGDFLAVTAPMKVGKTWWLMFIAVTALISRLKVLFISLEMPKRQMMRRFYQFFSGKSLYEKELTIPFFTKDGEIDHKVIIRSGLEASEAIKKSEQLKMLVGSGSLRLACYPTKSANVSTIKSILKIQQDYHGFVPDVIVIDYADILAPEMGASKEIRHRIDDTWSSIRGLAHERSCLCVTASQSTRATVGGKKDVESSDLAEDIRKLAHVSHMISLNQTKEERRAGISRIRVLANRNEEFDDEEDIVVLQNFSIGKPYIDSRRRHDVKL